MHLQAWFRWKPNAGSVFYTERDTEIDEICEET